MYSKVSDSVLFRVVAGVILDTVVALYRGWALAVLWRWFAVPLGAPTLDPSYAAGFCLIVSLVFSRTTFYEDHNIDWTATLVGHAVTPVATLLSAWVLLQVAF